MHKAGKIIAATAPRLPTGKVGRAIVRLLRLAPERSFTPYEIHAETGLNSNTIRKELSRLIKPRADTPGPVQRTGPGLYGAYLTPQDLKKIENPRPEIHALQLVWRAPGLPRSGGSAPRSRTHAHAKGAVLDAGFGSLRAASDEWIHVEESRSWQVTRWHGDHKVTLQVFPTTGTYMASVNSSRAPMDAEGIARLRIWLEATFQAEGFPWTEPRVATVEINRDFKRVRLAGRSAARFFLGKMGLHGERSLHLKHVEGVLVQIYNKEDLGVMRQEIRLQPRELDLDNLQSLVATMFYGPMPEAAIPDHLPDPEGGYA